MHRQTDGAALIGDGSGDGLADPPSGIGGELVTLLVIKLFSRTNQSQTALLDQILEGEAAVHVFLCDRNHEPEVRLHHFFLGASPQHQPTPEFNQRHFHQGRPFLGVGVVALIGFKLGGQLLKLQQIGDLAGQFDLLIRAQQPDAADFLQIDPDRILGVDPLGAHLDAGERFGFGVLFVVFAQLVVRLEQQGVAVIKVGVDLTPGQ